MKLALHAAIMVLTSLSIGVSAALIGSVSTTSFTDVTGLGFADNPTTVYAIDAGLSSGSTTVNGVAFQAITNYAGVSFTTGANHGYVFSFPNSGVNAGLNTFMNSIRYLDNGAVIVSGLNLSQGTTYHFEFLTVDYQQAGGALKATFGTNAADKVTGGSLFPNGGYKTGTLYGFNYLVTAADLTAGKVDITLDMRPSGGSRTYVSGLRISEAVPEPASLSLLLLGGLVALRRRQ